MNRLSQERSTALAGRVYDLNEWLVAQGRAIRLALEVLPPTHTQRFVRYRLKIFARRGPLAGANTSFDLGRFHEASHVLDALRFLWVVEREMEKSPGV